MTQEGARSVGSAHDTTPDSRRRRGLTPAQWYCLLVGLSLLLAGAFGFLADASFDTGGTADTDRTGNADGQLQGDGFLGFEVNAWHNIVHLLSGLVLLAAFRRRGPARTVALAFGVVYGVVALIGLIDGSDVLGIIPVNGADNVLHIALSALGILTALMSRGDDERGKSDTPVVAHGPDRARDRRRERDHATTPPTHSNQTKEGHRAYR
jgi:Domain of unknown function (DUF4383)